MYNYTYLSPGAACPVVVSARLFHTRLSPFRQRRIVTEDGFDSSLSIPSVHQHTVHLPLPHSLPTPHTTPPPGTRSPVVLAQMGLAVSLCCWSLSATIAIALRNGRSVIHQDTVNISSSYPILTRVTITRSPLSPSPLVLAFITTRGHGFRFSGLSAVRFFHDCTIIDKDAGHLS